MNEELHTPGTVSRAWPARVQRASWGAIFAGTFVTIVLQILFTVLGTAIGASTINPMQERTPTEGLAIGSGIWLVVTGLISVWVGACVAGRLSGGPRRADGMLHGIVTWSVATTAMVLLLASATSAVVGGVGSLLGQSLSARGGPTGMAGMQEQVRTLFPQAGALLPPTGRTEGQQMPGNLTALAQQDPELGLALGQMASRGGAENAPQQRDKAVNLLVTKHNMNQQEALNLVNQWDQQFRQIHAQAAQQAREAGEAAASGVAQAAWWSFGALLLGLLAAAWGGWVGTASLRRTQEIVPAPA